MLREADNTVRIVGTLSEVDLKDTSYTKDGQRVEALGGTVKIRVNQIVSEEEVCLEVPVYMFSGKYTSKGTLNPAYESIQKIMTEYTSIAAASNNAVPDMVSITKGQIRMNEYHDKTTGLLRNETRISSSFLNKITNRDNAITEATFTVEFMVADKVWEVDKDGVETGRLKVSGIMPIYGGKVQIVDFFASNKNVSDSIDQYWNKGDTVRAVGKLNFTSKTETILEEVDFGEPIAKVKTTFLNELLITGGDSTPLEADFAFNMDEINTAIAERKNRLEAKKIESEKKGNTKSAPPQKSNPVLDDLGF